MRASNEISAIVKQNKRMIAYPRNTEEFQNSKVLNKNGLNIILRGETNRVDGTKPDQKSKKFIHVFLNEKNNRYRYR